MKRFEAARFDGQFLLVPSIGFVYKPYTAYAPRIAVAWLWWGCSFGLGKPGSKWLYDR